MANAARHRGAPVRPETNDPEAPLAIFDRFPTPRQQEDFLRWVRGTGKPDEWRYHARSKPILSGDFELVLNFEVPESLRSSVPRATCPICSPNSPQYFEGALIWFRSERKVRAVGHDCAKRYLGTSALDNALERKRNRDEISAAQDYLLSVLPTLDTLRTDAARLLETARDADAFHRLLWRHGTKRRWIELRRSGQNGSLSVYRDHLVTRQRPDGTEYEETVSIPVGSRPVHGLRFMAHATSIEAELNDAVRRFGHFPASNDGAVLEALVTWENDGSMPVRARDLRQAIDVLNRVKEAIDEARAFVAPENLETLDWWTNDPLVASALRVRWEPQYPARIEVGTRGQRLHAMSIPPQLLTTR